MELTSEQKLVLSELAWAFNTTTDNVLKAVLDELVERYKKQPTLAKMLVRKTLMKGAV